VTDTHTHTHTHRQTDRHTTTAYTALSKASRGKQLMIAVPDENSMSNSLQASVQMLNSL